MKPDHPKLSGWQPPGNYGNVSSSLSGITVYAPLPEEKAVEIEQPKNYDCPQCGANTGYDVSAGGVACKYCGYVAPKKESKKPGKNAQEFEFTLETLSQAEQGWGVEKKELHCDNCGATIIVEEGEISKACPFCTSNKVNLQVSVSDRLRPRFLIPFKIQKEENKKLAKEWLGKGWYHPSELSTSSSIQSFSGIYLPFWTFDAYVSSTWKAELGYDEEESYHEDGEWKTRTVTRWRWRDGRADTIVDDLLITGSSNVSSIILGKLYPFNMTDLLDYSPDYLAGWNAQAYDITLPHAWEKGKAKIRNIAKEDCYSDTGKSSSHIRNFSMTADFSNETWRYILLPVYISAYKFNQKVYQVMVNGQTGKVAGQKPVAWWKVWLAIAAMIAPGVLTGLLGLVLLILGVGIPILIVAFILVIAGIIGSTWLYYKAAGEEEA